MDTQLDPNSNAAELTHKSSGSGSDAAKSVLSLFRRFLTPKNDAVREPTPPPLLPHTQPHQHQPERSSTASHAGAAAAPVDLPLLSPRQRRLKVAVVGEPESGRTTLCKSLADAAVGKTPHPLVVSGDAASLKMDASVLSVQTYNIDTGTVAKGDEGIGAAAAAAMLEVTVVDSGPAPLSEGAGSTALMEADAVLLCFPLYCIKQVVARSPQGEAQPTDAFISTRDYQRLTTLLTLLSTRVGWAEDFPGSAPPAVLIVGTFQDALKDDSVSATHTILRSLHHLGERVRQRSPAMPPLSGVYAVSATEGTAVSLRSDTSLDLREWWRTILDRAEAAGQASSCATAAAAARFVPPTTASPTRRDGASVSSIPPSVVRHVLGHPSRMPVLNAGMRIITHGRGSPRFLDANTAGAGGSAHAAFPSEVASAETRADDAKVTSLVIDFVTQLKARKKGPLLLPLPRLWRVAYALGMQTREQLYLVLRQMEATGEVSLLGRGLAYTQQSLVARCGATNETVCLCPALLRTAYAILYVYVDWVVHRQQRHVRRCLRGVRLQACAALDPQGEARRGVFPIRLLRVLAVALGLKNTSADDAAALLVAVLVGADAAYIHHQEETAASVEGAGDGNAGVGGGDSVASHPHDPLTAPIVASPSSSSSAAASLAVTPRRAHTAEGTASTASPTHVLETLVIAPLSISSSTADLSTLTPVTSLPSPNAARRDSGTTQSRSHHDGDDGNEQLRSGAFSPNITVAELTSLFLLGELTAAPAASGNDAAATAASTAAFDSASFDPVRAALQGGDVRISPPRRATAAVDDTVLVVPSLQPSALCSSAVARLVLRAAAASTKEVGATRGGTLRASHVAMRVSPYPYDLVSLLTCRFASVARRVEQAYANAVLLSFRVDELLHPTTDHVPLFPRRPAAPASPHAPLTTADACCFLFCEPPADASPSSSTVLRLVCFAASTTRVALLTSALCSELRMMLLQRLPGMTMTAESQSVVERGEEAALPELAAFASVDDLIRFVREAS